jgi:hypothetical protein
LSPQFFSCTHVAAVVKYWKLIHSRRVSSVMDDFKESDALWELLGRARRAKASPYFARKVLSAIREEKQPRFSVAALLRWVIPAAACAALLIGWSAYQHEQQDAFNAYFDSAADLQSLIASEDVSLWLEERPL